MASFDDVNPMRGNKMPRVEEQAAVLELPADEFVKGRFVGPVMSVALYWFDILKKDGTKTKIPRVCLDYDPTKQAMVRDICPYRASGKGQLAQSYYTNFLVRDLQDAMPRKKNLVLPSGNEKKKKVLLDDFECHIKNFDTKSWTPYRLLRLTATLAEKAINLKNLNVHKVKGVAKKFSIAHPKYGMDVNVMYSPKAAGAAKYDLQREDRTALTEEEMNYLFQPLDISSLKPFSLKDAKKDWEDLKKVIIDADKDDKDEEDTKKDRNKKKNKSEQSNSKDRDRGDRKDRNKLKDKGSKKSSKSSKSESKDKKKKKKNFSSGWDM
jgi:hypothetical protein